MSKIDLLAIPALHKVRVTSLANPIMGDITVLFADKTGALLPDSQALAAHIGATDVAEYLKVSGFKGAVGDVIHYAARTAGGLSPLMLVGVGATKKLTEADVRSLGGTVSRKLGAGKFTFALVAMETFLTNADASVRAFMTGMQTATYVVNDLKTGKTDTPRPAELRLAGNALNRRKVASLLAEVDAAVSGAHLTRRLIDLPPDIVTTDALKDVAEELAKRHKHLKVTVYDRKKLTELGMNLMLAVAQGSDQQPYMVQLTYTGSKKAPLVDLVGKGLVYDTGGLNIKTGDYMAGMKTDMAGAATVLGVLQAAASIEAPLNLRATLCLVENAVGPRAVRPDEVRTAYNGTTVEITDTDAEGRLVLYDALAFVKDNGADTILDFATLTGSIVAALGNGFAGLFCNDGTLAGHVLASAKTAGEGLWQMPLTEATDYEDALKSTIADLRNWQQRDIPDSIGASLFLHHAVKTRKKGGPRGRLKTPLYAHFDIAGTADGAKEASGSKTGKNCATGFAVRTVLGYLLAHKTA
jgi:leucyl aminopeptidase